MQSRNIVLAIAGAVGAFLVLSGDAPEATVPARPDANTVVEQMGAMPLPFIKNEGQWDERVLFRTSAGGASVWFCRDGISYQFMHRVQGEEKTTTGSSGMRGVKNPFAQRIEPDSVEMVVVKAAFVQANPEVELAGEDLLEYRCNYFLGNDTSRWRSDVSSYAHIIYRGIYPGIDAQISNDGEHLQTSWVAKPGADLSRVKFRYEGNADVSLTVTGELSIAAPWGTLMQSALIAPGGKLIEAHSGAGASSYGLSSSSSADATAGVALVYSTFLGGSDDDYGTNIAVDAFGSAYVTGITYSSNFPTHSALDGTQNGSEDAFVTKLSAAGNTLVYSTFLGGVSRDQGFAIAVDASGSAYLTGWTQSTDFPTQNPYDGSLGGNEDAFVTKLSAMGNALVYSTYLGGTVGAGEWSGDDEGYDIAVDALGSAYVTGETTSSDFPTQNSFDNSLGSSQDAFITKLSVTGSTLVYSTYLGGNNGDASSSIAVDASGNAYVSGLTFATDFPTQNPYDANLDGFSDVFVTKLSAAGNALVYSTYLGGGGGFETCSDIAVDALGNSYVVGTTPSADFPTQNPYDGTLGGGQDAFVTKLSATGNTLVYSTYLGGNNDEWVSSIAVDASGNAHVVGSTSSADFPLQNPYDANLGGGMDAFVTKLSAAGNALAYSTYLGGSGDDGAVGITVGPSGNVYLAGWTQSTDFPTQNPYDGSHNGGWDVIVMKLSEQSSPVPAHVRLSQIRVMSASKDSIYLPSETPPLSVGEHVFITGRVLDDQLTGIPNAVVRCYDPITGSYASGDSCVYRVTTDAAGYFTYPDPVVSPDGLTCNRSELFALWFNAGGVAIPLILPVSNGGTDADEMGDSLSSWMQRMAFPAGTSIGTVDDTLSPFVVRIRAYPPSDANLSDQANDAFFEAFALTYHGTVDEPFLSNGASSWLERGLTSYEQRVQHLADTLHSYLMSKRNAIRTIAYVDSQGEVVLGAPGSSDGFWDKADLVISYGLDGGMCAVGVLAVAGGVTAWAIVPACAPLIARIAKDKVVEPYVHKALCDDRLTDEEKRVACKAGSSVVMEMGLMVVTPSVSSIPKLARASKWINYAKYAKWARPYQTLIQTKGVMREAKLGRWIGQVYEAAPVHGRNASTNDVESFGLTDLEYEDPENPSISGTRRAMYLTLLTPPRYDITRDWDYDANPTQLAITVSPDRYLFDRGTTTFQSVAPTLMVHNASGSVPVTLTQIIDQPNRFAVMIPVSQLPGYTPGQPFNATITTQGYDLSTNYGSWDAGCGLRQCDENGMAFVAETGEGITIPAGAITGSVSIAIGGGVPAPVVPYAWSAPSSTNLTYVSGNVLSITPDTLSLAIPGEIAVKFNLEDLRYVAPKTQRFVARWDSDLLKWTPLSGEIDTLTGMARAAVTRLGSYAVIFQTVCACDCHADPACDGVTDILDVVNGVNVAFRGAAPEIDPNPFCPYQETDVDCTGATDVLDVVKTVNVAFRGANPATEFCNPCP